MRLLLDTHIVLWWMQDKQRVPKVLATAITSGDNDVAVSPVSIWEITIKRMRGRLEIEIDDLLIAMAIENFTELPLRFVHPTYLQSLPKHHNDPFDRMLIAQAIQDGRRLVTTDEKILKYAGASGFDPLSG